MISHRLITLVVVVIGSLGSALDARGQRGGVSWLNNGTFLCTSGRVDYAAGDLTCSSAGVVTIPAASAGVSTATAPLVITGSDVALAPVGQTAGDLLIFNTAGTAWTRLGTGGAGNAGLPLTVSVAGNSWGASALSVQGGGTGLTAVPANGQLWIGDGSGAPTLAAISDGTGISISNGAGSITPSVTSAFLRQESTTLTNTQILALRASSVTVTAAAGSGNFIEFVSASLFFNRVAGYTETADNLQIVYIAGATIGASAVIETTGFVDAAGDAITVVGPAAPIVTAAGQISNSRLAIVNVGDGEFGGGDAGNTITVVTTYRILATGF